MKMRFRYIKPLAVLAAASLISVGCATDGESDLGAETEDQDAGAGDPADETVGEFIYVSNQEPSAIDAFATTTVNEAQVAAQIYETLVYVDTNMEIQAGLAESWQLSDDATEATFELREGVTFHNGDPFDAEAVKAHFDRILDDTSSVGGTVARIEELYEGTEVIDDYTVRLDLNAAAPDLLLWLADPGFGITNASAAGADSLEESIVGTGPFMFEDWVDGSHITLSRNPDWTWGNEAFFGTSGPARIETLTLRFISEAETRSAALSTGEVHFVDQIPTHEVEPMLDADDVEVEGARIPGLPQMNYINPSVEPTNDLQARRAILHAVDQDAIISTSYFDMVSPAHGPLSSDFPSYEPALEDMYPYDPEVAREMLEEAGWSLNDNGVREKDGQTLSVRITENAGWNDWVTMLQAQLREVGFDATIETFEGGGYYEEFQTAKYELPAMGSVFVTPTELRSFFHSSEIGALNGGAVDDPRVDELLDAITQEIDRDAREEMLRELQVHIMEQAYMIPIFELEFFNAYLPSVEGHVLDGSGYYKYFAGASI